MGGLYGQAPTSFLRIPYTQLILTAGYEGFCRPNHALNIFVESFEGFEGLVFGSVGYYQMDILLVFVSHSHHLFGWTHPTYTYFRQILPTSLLAHAAPRLVIRSQLANLL
mgnify:CR=1 FL=1